MCFNSAFTGLSGVVRIHLRIKFSIKLRAGGEEMGRLDGMEAESNISFHVLVHICVSPLDLHVAVTMDST